MNTKIMLNLSSGNSGESKKRLLSHFSNYTREVG